MRKMQKNRILILLLSFAMILSAGVFASGLVSDAATSTQTTQEYALQYDRYKLKESNALVTYNGESVRTVNGYVTFKNTGTYKIKYTSGEVEVNVYREIPDCDLVLSEEFSDLAVGVPYLFPTAVITDFLGNGINEYSVSVMKSGEEIFKVENGTDAEFTFPTVGEYDIEFEYDTVFGVKGVKKYPVNVTEKKVISVGNYDKRSYLVGDSVSLSEIYGYYKGEKYDRSIKINGKTVEDETYSFSNAGVYAFSVTSNIDGEVLKYTFDLKVSYDPSKSFVTNDCVGVTDKIVSLPYEVARRSRASEGVEIITKKSDSYAVFGGVVDLTKLTSSQNLIEFHVLSNDYANMDFINVRLIDIYDPDNWVLVRWLNCLDGGGTPKEKGNHSYVYVSTSSGIDTISKKGTTVANDFVNHTATFYYKLRGWTGMFNLQMDYSNLQLFHYASLYGASSHKMLADLDDVTDVGNDKIFKGFTDGKVYVQLEFLSVSGDRSGVIVTQMAGKNIEKYFDEAEEFNTITVDADIDYVKNGLPDGVVGMKYSIPSALQNNIVSRARSVDRKLYFGEEDITSEIDGDLFTPDKTGEYAVVFSSSDVFGRETKYEMPFCVVEEHRDIIVEKSDEEIPEVNSYWQPPELILSGGHGKLSSTTKIYVDGEEVIPDEAGQIFVSRPCGIEVKTSITDYLGFTEEYLLLYEAEYSGVFLDIKGVPDYLKQGQIIDVPSFAAHNFDYDVGESGYEMSAKIYINDNLFNTGETYTVPSVSSVTFKFVADEGKQTETTDIRSVKVDNIDKTGDMSGYFSAQDVTAQTTNENQTFIFGKDVTIDFKNALACDNLNFQFSFDSDYSAPEYFTVRLTDYFDESVSIDLDFYEFQNGFSRVETANGVSYILGSFTGVKYDFYYNNYYHNLQSNVGIQYMLLNRTAKNNLFTGFKSGIVKVKFIFNGVYDSVKFKIFVLGNQSFSLTSYRNGDKKGPMLLFNDLKSNYEEVAYGTEYVISECKAYDVLQGIGNVVVSFTDPTGKAIYNNTAINKVSAVKMNKYGYWILTYTATDNLGNRTQTKINVYVPDTTSPVISVNLSEIKESYVSGETISIPEASITDDTGYTLKIYVLTPDGKYHFVSGDMTYRAQTKGKNVLVYMAYDNDYNIARTEKEFIVE